VDFDAIENELREDSERYRGRHLSVKLSLYAGFFAFEGIAVAAGAIIANRSSLIAAVVISISLVSMSILFLLHRWFLRLFDALGYTKISIQSQSDLDAYWARNEQSFAKLGRLERWRRFFDTLLFVLAATQMLLLIAWLSYAASH
jgi:hypothetical protein